MKILVLVKEVPDMNRVKFDRENGVVKRSSAPAEINPFDMNVLAEALEIKKSCDGTTITVLTMGPPSAEKSLRDAYARGADRVCLLTDPKFGGSDTLATSTALSLGIRRLGDFDLILCGEKSVDGDTAQVGPEVAELLSLPHASYVERFEDMEGKAARVVISELCQDRQVREISYPCVLSMTKNIAVPKLPTVDRKLESLEINVEKLTANDLKKDGNLLPDGREIDKSLGVKGSPTKVKNVVIQEKPERIGVKFKGDKQGFIETVMKKMEELGIE